MIASPQDGPELWDLVEPGVLTIFHLSGRRIGKQDVLPLCVSLLAALSEPSAKHGPMQRVFVLRSESAGSHSFEVEFAIEMQMVPLLQAAVRQGDAGARSMDGVSCHRVSKRPLP